MVNIVNIVTSGQVGRELDLSELYRDLELDAQEYNPGTHPGIHLKFEEDGPLITLYSSGSYVVMGAKSHESVEKVYQQLIDALDGLGVEVNNSSPEIQNIICKGYLNREVNLSSLAIALGLENTEYEPEQSPFLYYWPDEFDCVVSIPANGEIVITGITEVGEAKEIFEFVKERIDSILG